METIEEGKTSRKGEGKTDKGGKIKEWDKKDEMGQIGEALDEL